MGDGTRSGRAGTRRVSWPAMLLVFGPRSTDYDFGPGHPLTPRRFGPGIDLLRAVGAEPGLAPEPAPTTSCCGATRRATWTSSSGSRTTRSGFRSSASGRAATARRSPGCTRHRRRWPAGRIRAVEAILRGDVEHAQHPGGGLHHAMPERASGFCIYDDPALAIARARRDGLRVMYIDLDVHHGDGVQAMHWDDPGVLTFSIHETGRALFPGTGDVDEVGEGVAAGTSVNVPLPPGTGEGAWLDAVTLAAPRAGRHVRARPHRVAARRRFARLGSARPPERDDDRPWGGGPARGHARAPARAGPLAGDRRWRVRRLSGRAADLGPDLAGRRASGGAGDDAAGLARAMGDRGGTVRAGAAPRAVRRRAERRARVRRHAGGRGGAGGRGRGARPARARAAPRPGRA